MAKHLTEALKVRSFLFLWLAEVFSQIGANMMNFLLILVAFSITRSNTAVSGIVLSFTVPAIIFGLLAGVYVDRWDKKKVLFNTNLLRGALLLGLVFFHNNIFALYFFSFLVTTGTQFFIPAETPIIPLIVKKELLFSANALFGIALYGSMLIAYALSGPFLTLFGTGFAFLALAICFFIGAICVLPMRSKQIHEYNHTKKTINQSLIVEIKTTFAVIFRTKELYTSFFLLILIQILILMIAVIGPGYAENILKIPINEFPLLFVTPATIGMAIGAILLTTRLHDVSKEKMTTTGLLICSLVMFLLPYSSKTAAQGFLVAMNSVLLGSFSISIIHIMILLAAILGLALAFIFVPANTILQEKTTDEIRGKIYGALNTIVAVCSLFPVIMAGSLADIFGVSAVLIGIGVIIGVLALWRIKSLFAGDL